MIGAIIGDIIGSTYENNNVKTKDFDLFPVGSHPTDDSMMTIAIADAILDCYDEENDIFDYDRMGEVAVEKMVYLGRLTFDAGYGPMFLRWIFSEDHKPYNSYGNGSAMRISAVGDIAKSLEEAKKLSKCVTEVTHDHPDGLKGAEALATVIFLLREGKSKEEIKKYVEDNYYSLDFTLDDIRDDYYAQPFNMTCEGTIPQAIVAFLESESFEDAIRNAISIGGDSDTLAAMAGSMAEAYYEDIPDWMIEVTYYLMSGYAIDVLESVYNIKDSRKRDE